MNTHNQLDFLPIKLSDVTFHNFSSQALKLDG